MTRPAGGRRMIGSRVVSARHPEETPMRMRAGIPAAFALALMSATMAVPACAHASPTTFVNCMAESGKGAALINAVNNVLDGDNRVQVLEQLAIAVGPDVLKCVLEQVASAKSAGPGGNQRSLRAREYLDSHGGNATRSTTGSGALTKAEGRARGIRICDVYVAIGPDACINFDEPATLTPINLALLWQALALRRDFIKGGGGTSTAGVGSLPHEGPAADTSPAAPGPDGPGVLLAGICYGCGRSGG